MTNTDAFGCCSKKVIDLMMVELLFSDYAARHRYVVGNGRYDTYIEEFNHRRHRTGEELGSPLSRAVENGNRNAVELLLKYGARPDFHGHNRYTPLELAERLGSHTIVQMLKSAP
ncbi:hypothetical protein B0J13DRAFT_533800 [Dactylonectria estremocensis]|uniref:Ankyrin repeat protein n=1 Tax=Dactylonectria estremocensis TaxID=1079267 RepID=A0A9P9D708_9HYPO|nr:hypothetical protein B0J13DRAFT_533800 [Dactylonectria estremocensis]